MARNQDQEKDFLDIDLDDPLEGEEIVIEDKPSAVAASLGDGVLLYDNKKYAVGLSWLIAEEEGDTELATRRAKGFHADFYCLRQNVATQHGFGFLSKGHRVGQQALASVAADVLVGEWHGVFVADNGWWYVAVHADNLAPDGDLFFTSEETAYNHFIAKSESYRWPRAYAPESWNIPEAGREISLSKIIGEAAAPVLKPVTMDAIFSGKKNKNLAIGAVVALIGLLILGFFAQQFLPGLMPMQAQIPAPNVQVSDVLQAPPKEPVIFDEKGQGLANFLLLPPPVFVKQCLEAFADISIPLPGWRLSKLKCKDTFVEGTWTRQTGSYELVEPYLNRFPDTVTRTFADASTLLATRRLIGDKPAAEDRDLFDRNYAIISLKRRFGNMGTLDVKEVTPAATQQLLQGVEMLQQQGFGSVGQNKPVLQPLNRDDLPYLSIAITSETPPNLIGEYFDLPGLILNGVESDISSGNWQYTGKLILQPDKRLIEANAKAKALQQTQ